MNIIRGTSATENVDIWNVPVMSIKNPNVTGITSGPILPREEMRPITPPVEAERRPCSRGAARQIQRAQALEPYPINEMTLNTCYK